MEKVSVVKCDSYNNKKIQKTLAESLKNIDFTFKKNMKVLIKPNLLYPVKPEKAITTHPVIIEELCKILKKYNAEIYIGDSSSHDTDWALKISGMSKLSKYAKIINFDSETKRFLAIGERQIPFPNLLFKMDLIINVAKMKTHALTNVSLCVKNLYGCIPGKMKKNLHRTILPTKDFSKFLLEIHYIVKPQLNIIDGITGIEGEGPGAAGRLIKSDLILAGKNAIAVDIIASEIMGFNSNKIYTNKFSEIKKEEIETIGDGKNIKLNFKKPRLYAIRFVVPLLKVFLTPRIKFNKEKCTRCHLCEEKCPVNAIQVKSEPKCNYKKCINCLCCIEICPNGAINLQEHFLYRNLKYFYNKIIENKKD